MFDVSALNLDLNDNNLQRYNLFLATVIPHITVDIHGATKTHQVLRSVNVRSRERDDSWLEQTLNIEFLALRRQLPQCIRSG